MKLAKVIGTLVATQKDPKLEGLRYLVLGNYGPDNTPEAGSVVAVDGVGAGVGEMVLYASGSSARQTVATVSYTHLTLPTIILPCRSRWWPYH